MRIRLVALAGLAVLLAACASTGASLRAGNSHVSSAVFSLRPVLCFAPPYAPSGQPGYQTTGTLPACSAQYGLTAAQLQVEPNSNSAAGFTSSSTIAPDPQFASYPSSSTEAQIADPVVLLPGSPATGGPDRYVVGPAQVTASSVQAAHSIFLNGQWMVNLTFTPTGAKQWDHLAKAQFHAIVAVVVNGTVVSAPITQPTQYSFTSFSGLVQLAGGFTEHQAKSLAAELAQGTSD